MQMPPLPSSQIYDKKTRNKKVEFHLNFRKNEAVDYYGLSYMKLIIVIRLTRLRITQRRILTVKEKIYVKN